MRLSDRWHLSRMPRGELLGWLGLVASVAAWIAIAAGWQLGAISTRAFVLGVGAVLAFFVLLNWARSLRALLLVAAATMALELGLGLPLPLRAAVPAIALGSVLLVLARFYWLVSPLPRADEHYSDFLYQTLHNVRAARSRAATGRRDDKGAVVEAVRVAQRRLVESLPPDAEWEAIRKPTLHLLELMLADYEGQPIDTPASEIEDLRLARDVAWGTLIHRRSRFVR